MGDIDGAWPNAEVKSRFLDKVDFNGPVCEHLGSRCYLWTAYTDPKGYGRFGLGGRGHAVRAHRLAYEVGTGEKIPPGLQVDHLCHRRRCVRPSHLRLATNLENCQNPAGASKNSQSGILGVHWDANRNKWRASIRVEGKLINLGRFADLDSAIRAREGAERKYFARPARFGDIGDNPRRIEVIPATKPVRQPVPEPAPVEPVKVPEKEPVPA